MALAQITYTLTQLPAVSSVRFLVAGQEVSVPSGDGSSVGRPVTPEDYPEVRPL
jgi:spore germination protein GerM